MEKTDISNIWKRDDIWADHIKEMKWKTKQAKPQENGDQLSLISEDVHWIDVKYDY